MKSLLVKDPYNLWKTIDLWLLGDKKDSEHALARLVFVAEVIERVYGRRCASLRQAGLCFRRLLEQLHCRTLVLDGDLVMLIWNWRYKVEDAISELQQTGALDSDTEKSLDYQVQRLSLLCEQCYDAMPDRRCDSHG